MSVMKLPFHVTLLTLILTLLVLLGGAIGFTSYRTASAAVEDLSQQVLGHVEKRIDQQINKLLFTAIEKCELSHKRLESNRFPDSGARAFAVDLLNVMKQNPWFTMVGYTLDATGDGLYVRRIPNGDLHIAEGHWNGQTGQMEIKEFTEQSYPNGPFQTMTIAEDLREELSFAEAKAAGKLVWHEAQRMPRLMEGADMLGLTCAIPVKRNDSVWGVFSTTIYLGQLRDFLSAVQEADNEDDDSFQFMPFIVEIKSDQTRSVIAHPNRDILAQTAGAVDKRGRAKLVQAEESIDPLVSSFMKELRRLHPKLEPAKLKQLPESQLLKLTKIRFKYEGIHYRGTFRCLSTDRTPDWLICIIVPERSILGRVDASIRNAFIIVIGTAVAAVLLSLLMAVQTARPLRRMARQAVEIGQFRLSAEPVPYSIVREVDRLSNAMERMKASLRSFQKYVPAEVVRTLLAAGKDASLGGERKTVTTYFSDIEDFTSIAERLSCEELVKQLAEYFGQQSNLILGMHGTVDKYIGDAIMAFWGAPLPDPKHALNACTAAVRNQDALRKLREKWQTEQKTLFVNRIGINTGEVVVGNIGSEARLNYTVIGDAVNLASRLEGLNKYYGTQILISETTYEAAKEGIVARPLDRVSVKGKKVGILVYELLGLKGEVTPSAEELVQLSSQALDYYLKQDWARAIELFEKVLKLKHRDQPARLLIKRCQDYQAKSPPEDWSGVYHMAAK